jgi:hypothetical protein
MQHQHTKGPFYLLIKGAFLLFQILLKSLQLFLKEVLNLIVRNHLFIKNISTSFR